IAEVILQRDGLAVEGEPIDAPGALELRDDAVDGRKQARTVSRDRLVPLAIPMRVRHHDRAPGHARPRETNELDGQASANQTEDRAAENVARIVHAEIDAFDWDHAAEPV